MTTATEEDLNMPHYDMFSDAGDAAVHQLVETAQRLAWTWPEVLFQLEALRRRPGCEEATDTAVRESVFNALRFYEKDVDFYA